ncbi:MAG TPA: ferrous iron transport protein A [Thermodesulforhabdus norvegica]|uniref:Ferrous iron transport protein A n=1 Tax=Thermodesulforhabdus norvegica TaxID=39841 RepID=A0A7C0WUB1_9BACT|nr:ferrous iron transport protein A [Deltaproteobacteria bacterium]MBW2069583.1 ferrous iron transport protein A [Deltaproteobacteria bacterium]HDL89832.1 ferrous iron transport protein A [Thermodesulforhabdus norvegica]
MKGRSIYHSEIPLPEAEPGASVRITRIEGGRRLCARLAHMGIYPGTIMEVISSGRGAPCIVRVRNATISLGRGMSRKIIVYKL